MNNGSSQKPTATPRRYRGPQGLGEQVARALEQCDATGQGIGAVAEESFLKQWSEENRILIPEDQWQTHKLISQQTAEHEVRYRRSDHRAVKRTWPGTFGFVPKHNGQHWEPKPATPGEYLLRQALQNELFGDEVRLEGAMLSASPSMIIGQSSGGLSLVISQPWLDASNPQNPHPSEVEIIALLKDRGFRQLIGSLFGWQQDESQLVILDAKPDNFVSTEAGILPIDLLLTQCTSSS